MCVCVGDVFFVVITCELFFFYCRVSHPLLLILELLLYIVFMFVNKARESMEIIDICQTNKNTIYVG